MRLAVCHYSFHRLWEAEKWDCEKLCAEVAAAGAEGVDFHARLTGDPDKARREIPKALAKTGLTLSGISLGNSFYPADEKTLREQIQTVKTWVDVAADLKAPVSRIFGGGRVPPEQQAAAMEQVKRGLLEVTAHAAKKGVVLALENHGGIPRSGEDQVALIKAVNSPYLRATVDVGNYMSGGQEGAEGTRIAAKHCAYVHFKDFIKVPSKENPWGWDVRSCTVGVGAVDHAACLKRLKAAGYKGWIALEYEGLGEERVGVFESLAFTKKVLAQVSAKPK